MIHHRAKKPRVHHHKLHKAKHIHKLHAAHKVHAAHKATHLRKTTHPAGAVHRKSRRTHTLLKKTVTQTAAGTTDISIA